MHEHKLTRPNLDLDQVNFPEEVEREVREHLGGGGGGILNESPDEHHLHEKPGATPDFGISPSRGGWQF